MAGGQALLRPARSDPSATPRSPRRRPSRSRRARPASAAGSRRRARHEVGLAVHLDEDAARVVGATRLADQALRWPCGRPSSRRWPGRACAGSCSLPRSRRSPRSSAVLHSIIPAPVWSRSFFTSAAIVIAIVSSCDCRTIACIAIVSSAAMKGAGLREPAHSSKSALIPEPWSPCYAEAGAGSRAAPRRARAWRRPSSSPSSPSSRVDFGVDRLLHVAARDDRRRRCARRTAGSRAARRRCPG